MKSAFGDKLTYITLQFDLTSQDSIGEVQVCDAIGKARQDEADATEGAS